MNNTILEKKKRVSDQVLYALIQLSSFLSIFILLVIIGYILYRGIPAFDFSYLVNTTSIINDLRKLITKYPDIKIFINEDIYEIKNHIPINNISTTLNDDIDLIVIGDYLEQNIPISLLKPYIYTKPIWFELRTEKEVEVIKHKYEEEINRAIN